MLIAEFYLIINNKQGLPSAINAVIQRIQGLNKIRLYCGNRSVSFRSGRCIMNTIRQDYWFVIVVTILLGGCGPQATATESQAVNTPEAIPITYSGPAMEVGSSFLYPDGTVLVAVPGGPFTMGGDVPDNPDHQVTLPDFWIYSTKVTNLQYAYCVKMGLCTPLQFIAHNPNYDDPLHGNDPMVGVDYDQATAYCQFVNARLPTEAEWEKAARGPNANIYPWGNNEPECELLNYDVCVGRTTPVNTYPDGRSYYQAFDMEGNAFEWVFDRYQADYFLNSPADNPQGPEKGLQRVVRSSAYNSGANQTQTYNRFHSRPDTVRDNLGFRCVVEDATYFASFCEYPATYGTNGIGGASTGKDVQVNCPELTIKQNPSCQGITPVTNIDMNPITNNLQWQITVTGGQCTSGVTSIFECSGHGEITFCGTCIVKITTPPQCPANYSYDSDAHTCVGKGSPGVCLPGFTTTDTPTGQCCTLSPATPAPTAKALSLGTIVSYPLGPSPNCPAGTYPILDVVNGTAECTPLPVEFPYCKSEGIVLNSCTPGGGGDGQPQGCPPQSCEMNYSWDSSSCSCVCNGC